MEFVLPKRTLWFTFEIPPGKFGWFSKETHCTFGVKYDNHSIHTSYKPVLSCWFCHRRAHSLHSKHGILYLGVTRNLSFIPRDKDSEWEGTIILSRTWGKNIKRTSSDWSIAATWFTVLFVDCRTRAIVSLHTTHMLVLTELQSVTNIFRSIIPAMGIYLMRYIPKASN